MLSLINILKNIFRSRGLKNRQVLGTTSEKTAVYSNVHEDLRARSDNEIAIFQPSKELWLSRCQPSF